MLNSLVKLSYRLRNKLKTESQNGSKQILDGHWWLPLYKATHLIVLQRKIAIRIQRLEQSFYSTKLRALTSSQPCRVFGHLLIQGDGEKKSEITT